MGKEPPLERFIVGTGRCGSTLLSRMLAEHPGVLLALRALQRHRRGATLRTRADHRPRARRADRARSSRSSRAVLRRGYRGPEIVYPFGTRGRYRRDDALPWILVSLLPRLSDDPDAPLRRAAAASRRTLPAQPAPAALPRALRLARRAARAPGLDRALRLVDRVPGRAGRRVSGGALPAPAPRRPRGGALDARAPRLPTADLLPLRRAARVGPTRLRARRPIDLCATPRRDDPISQILASRPPAALFGRYWCDQIQRGLDRAAGRSRRERYRDAPLRGPDRDPEATLRAVERFFELPPDPGWRARRRAGAGPRAARTGARRRRARGAQDACEPGMQRLGRV